MSAIVLPAHVRNAMSSVSQVSDLMEIHQVMKYSMSFLFGEITEEDMKSVCRSSQIPFPTFLEAVDALSWIVCESVRLKLSTDNFREFIADIDFLNTRDVLEVYQQSSNRLRQSLNIVSPEFEKFVSIDWRMQVEVARRSLRNFKRPHVVIDLKTNKNSYNLELTPQGLVQLYETLDAALQSSRTAKFRRIQRFVK